MQFVIDNQLVASRSLSLMGGLESFHWRSGVKEDDVTLFWCTNSEVLIGGIKVNKRDAAAGVGNTR